ncbi:MAG TPA: transglycosylase domain-containing protein, partial [Thermoleophilaceae bacterium]|nr:transglycosylase domain-containing protein [Thermoleophilaceae bacterium]
MQEPPTTTLISPATEARPEPVAGGPVGAPPSKPKLKKLRLAFVLLGVALLAFVSTIFGMLMAVASDLPALDNRAEYERAENSSLLADTPGCREPGDRGCREIAKLTGNRNRILLDEGQISPYLKNAVIAVEDRRFYEHDGVDYKGIGRALVQDVLRQRAAQGGSTITQQFVKNALSAQGNRSVFQKLRESALAYNLERKWSKDKLLTQYLNTVYFGNGAYGVESAVRTYFGEDEAGGQESDVRAATDVLPHEAALLAGMIASPSLYDPVNNPRRATERRNLVLQRMLEQRMITRGEHDEATKQALPGEAEINPPRVESDQPYFSSWLTQQLVDRYRPGLVFSGGLEIKTTLDPELQAAAERAISSRLAGLGPDASLVAIENKTGEVKAMVGGESFERKPFNLATNGHRQPGSAFKAFTLVRALEDGVSPDATFASQKKSFPIRGGGQFVVNNYESSYFGVASLRAATAASDNSVYAELGLKVGTRRVARMARRMGVRTSISTNPAMTLGGLKQGVTPLELAYAYSTIANKGVKVSGSMAPGGEGPVAFERVRGEGLDEKNEKRSERVFSAQTGELAHQVLAGVVSGGTGRVAQIGEFAAGKTGTTENYGDAWFAGFNGELTVAVWVGYADKLRPMETEYRGGPVAGGTYPAEIWREFMSTWIALRERREEASGKKDTGDEGEQPLPAPAPPAPATPQAEEPAAPAEDGDGQAAPDAPREQPRQQEQPQGEAPPQQQPPPDAPAPAPGPTPAP